jgi:hypothetical protein
LLDATESPAGAYRARGTPGVLRVIEIMGILQARQWGVCTMNEFRQFLGLKQFESFEEWNPDPAIAVKFAFVLSSDTQMRFSERSETLVRSHR